MSKTAVGLFEHPGLAHQVVQDLEASAFPGGRSAFFGESRDMSVDGPMSTPRTDFEVGLNRELKAIGVDDRRQLPTSKECGAEAFSFSPQDQPKRLTMRLRS